MAKGGKKGGKKILLIVLPVLVLGGENWLESRI